MQINIFRHGLRGLRGLHGYGLAALLFTACAEADISYRPAEATQVLVDIYPDKSKHPLPPLTYHFYNTDTRKEQEVIVKQCDGQGNFSDMLPVGTYRVLATNLTVPDIRFEGMENHETAIAYATNLNVATRATPITFNLYHVAINEITVTAAEPNNRLQPPSALLTRTVSFTFTLDERLNRITNSITGDLYGIYPSVNLYSGKTSNEEAARSPQMGLHYEAVYQAGTRATGTWEVTLRVLGLHNPDHGLNYQNIMRVVLQTDEGECLIDIDLTHELSDMMDKYDGVIPLDIPLELDILLEWDGIKIDSKVRPWENGGWGEEEVN